MEEREHSYTIGGNVNWSLSFGRQFGGAIKFKMHTVLGFISHPLAPLRISLITG